MTEYTNTKVSMMRESRVRHAGIWLPIVAMMVLVCQGGHLLLAQAAQASGTAAHGRELRDGAHDFDFGVGVWHTHIRRVLDPLSGSQESMELNGTVTSRKIWGGRALLEEIEADGPKGHWEGLSLFLYNPQAHQWSQSFINSGMGELGPPLIGEFHDGRGELFSQDTYKGKAIQVRGVWTVTDQNAHRYEESYSDDGGRTWKVAFVGDKTRDESAKEQDGTAMANPAAAQEVAGQSDFNFDLGTWKVHTRRMLHPLTGSHDWVELDGRTVVKKVWGGRANIAEYDATGAGGHVVLLSLRWFNPVTREWNIDFATPQVGTLGVPGVGTFKNGRVDFYDYEPIGGRSVEVRFSIWKITDDTTQTEQAFSEDGGKTWETNWVNKYWRVKGE
jgi:hypothetical protein